MTTTELLIYLDEEAAELYIRGARISIADAKALIQELPVFIANAVVCERKLLTDTIAAMEKRTAALRLKLESLS